MKDELEKKISKAKKAIEKVVKHCPNAKLEIHPTETMFGTIINHIYLVDRLSSKKICLQKHLLTIE